ncbi:MAG: hypothetical protein R2795_11540 [Saprospiraceae bacterium]
MQTQAIDAVQPQCPTCSAKQGARLSNYSKQQKQKLNGKTRIQQLFICEKHGAIPCFSPLQFKIGASSNLKDNSLYPVHGLRHNTESGTTGWYIWAGEHSEEPDFFKPLHTWHLETWRPEVLKYLALPPGYRFLLGHEGYEDIWFDESLLLL